MSQHASSMTYVNGCMVEMKDIEHLKAGEVISKLRVDKDCAFNTVDDSTAVQKDEVADFIDIEKE